jgi:porin
MVNTSSFKNQVTGQMSPGNHSAYGLMDYQLSQPDPQHPAHGLYAGGSFITAPETINAYARYYEARAYQEAPFRSRPGDVLSAVASRTGYSSTYTDHLVSEGKTAWRAGTTLTGNYLSLGLSYVYGPAITPRVPNTLNFIANWSLFF